MQSAADIEKQYAEMHTELYLNMLKYGCGFLKLAQDEKGQISFTVVPIEDYLYLGEHNGEASSSL